MALLAGACGHPEQRVIDQYFNAVNAQDNQTLSSFAAVKFDQKVDRWSIVQVSPETRSPAALPTLIQKTKDIDKQIADNKKAASQYVLDTPKAVEVMELQRKNAKIPGNLAAVAAEWDKYNDKDRELKKALADAKEAADREKRDVLLSVENVPEIESLPGEQVEKQVDLTLTIKGEPKNYTMNLRKYDLQAAGQGGRKVSRWIVHKLEPKA
jgi:hypothetical protein